jgi:hypothetical protein
MTGNLKADRSAKRQYETRKEAAMRCCFGARSTINTDSRIDGRLLRAYTGRRGRVGVLVVRSLLFVADGSLVLQVRAPCKGGGAMTEAQRWDVWPGNDSKGACVGYLGSQG